ncbi:toxin [Mycobacterium xenopi 4042]|uniref:Toxin n=1 Tax=Mycobacterium xenopi 4042 TaxID=1299334 RepID=X8AH26_MYCXE|nr:toxin [Mycobacterium xenopi 4042]
MAKLSGSIDVPLPPEEAWSHAADLSRYKEWLTIHRVWRSKLPEKLDKGTVVESIVEVKGMPNRIKWTIVHFKPPEAMTLNGDGVGGVKVKLLAKVKPRATVRLSASTFTLAVRPCSGQSACWLPALSRAISASRCKDSSRCSPTPDGPR